MTGERQGSKVDAAIERLHATASRGDVRALVFEVEAKVIVDPARILREAFFLLHQIAPVPDARAAIARLAPLIPGTEAVQSDLGFLLQVLGDPEGASAALEFAARGQEARAAAHPQALGRRIVHPTWFLGSLGEMAARLSTLAKLTKLGLLPRRTLELPAPPDAVVSEPLLELFADHLTLVRDGPRLAEIQALAPDLAIDPTFMPIADGRFLHAHDAWRMAEQAWAVAGHGSLLSLPQSRLSAGRASLARIGLPADAWFVAMHVRAPAIFGDDERRYEDVAALDADVETYLPAVERIAALGGYVVRVGTSEAPKVPKVSGLVDYAHSDIQSAELDLVATAAARFMIGTVSGPAQMASAFGVPVVRTNCLPANLLAAPRDIWLPKLYRRREDGHVLTLAEALSAPFRGALRGSGFADYGIDLVPNEAEDIVAACEEMLERLEGRAPPEDPATEAVFTRTANTLTAPISARFLERHRGELIGRG